VVSLETSLQEVTLEEVMWLQVEGVLGDEKSQEDWVEVPCEWVTARGKVSGIPLYQNCSLAFPLRL
jgi:hypothetical protein